VLQLVYIVKKLFKRSILNCSINCLRTVNTFKGDWATHAFRQCASVPASAQDSQNTISTMIRGT